MIIKNLVIENIPKIDNELQLLHQFFIRYKRILPIYRIWIMELRHQLGYLLLNYFDCIEYENIVPNLLQENGKLGANEIGSQCKLIVKQKVNQIIESV